MSAESSINAYLQESGECTLTLESLQVYVEEGVSIKPLVGLLNFMKQIKGMASIDRVFSGKKNIVKTAAFKAVKAVDDDIFSDDGGSDNQSPVDTPAPKDDRQAESYLRRIYNYFKKFVSGLSFPEMKTVYRSAKSILTKMLMGVGLVGTAFVFTPLVIPMAIIIVIMCIFNAVEQTKDIQDETERINLKSAFNNVMTGFKKMFFSLKIDKHQGKFAIVSAVIAGFFWWIKEVVKIEKIGEYFANFIKFAKTQAVKAPNIAQSIVDLIDGTKMDSLAELKSTLTKFISKFNFLDDGKKKAIQMATIKAWSYHKEVYDKAIKDGMSSDEAKAFAKEAVRKKVEKIKLFNSPEWQGKKAAQVVYYGLAIVAVATILYLFAELVDHFNLKKVKEREDDREEFERTV